MICGSRWHILDHFWNMFKTCWSGVGVCCQGGRPDSLEQAQLLQALDVTRETAGADGQADGAAAETGQAQKQ